MEEFLSEPLCLLCVLCGIAITHRLRHSFSDDAKLHKGKEVAQSQNLSNWKFTRVANATISLPIKSHARRR